MTNEPMNEKTNIISDFQQTFDNSFHFFSSVHCSRVKRGGLVAAVLVTPSLKALGSKPTTAHCIFQHFAFTPQSTPGLFRSGNVGSDRPYMAHC